VKGLEFYVTQFGVVIPSSMDILDFQASSNIEVLAFASGIEHHCKMFSQPQQFFNKLLSETVDLSSISRRPETCLVSAATSSANFV
jgi:hypothetical protein